MRKARKNVHPLATNIIDVQSAVMDISDVEEVGDLLFNSLRSYKPCQSKTPYRVTITENGRELQMDSGAACSLISEDTYWALWPIQSSMLTQDTCVLRQWLSAPLKVLGRVVVEVKYRNIRCSLPLFLVQGHRTSLLSRDWFAALGINITGISLVQQPGTAAVIVGHPRQIC